MQQAAALTMKEVSRYSIICSLLENKMTNKQAAANLSLSERQILRLRKRVRNQGVKGVMHGNRGRQPPHTFSPELKEHVIALAKTRYFDFNFSHMSEMLIENEGIHVNRETLRQWLRPKGSAAKYEKSEHTVNAENLLPRKAGCCF